MTFDILQCFIDIWTLLGRCELAWHCLGLLAVGVTAAGFYRLCSAPRGGDTA